MAEDESVIVELEIVRDTDWVEPPPPHPPFSPFWTEKWIKTNEEVG